MNTTLLEGEVVSSPGGTHGRKVRGMVTWFEGVPWLKTPQRMWANSDLVLIGGHITCPGVDLPKDHESRRVTYTRSLRAFHVIEGVRTPNICEFVEQRPGHGLQRVRYSDTGLRVHNSAGDRMVEFVGETETLLVRQKSLVMIRLAHKKKFSNLITYVADSLRPTLLLYRPKSDGKCGTLVAVLAAISKAN